MSNAQGAVSRSSPGRVWRPGSWSSFPFLGISALVGAVAFAVCAAVVLFVSDGHQTDRWKVNGSVLQPTMLLAIFSSLTNALLRFAFDEGLTNAWWCNALKGTTLGQLHSTWAYGNSVFAVLASGRRFNLVALASILVSIVLIDGPLLQRASRVTTRSIVRETKLTVPISPEPFIRGATGRFSTRGGTPTLYSPIFASVMQEYNNKSGIAIPGLKCDGVCETTIEAPGFDVGCQDYKIDYKIPSLDDYFEAQKNPETWNLSSVVTYQVNITYDRYSGGIKLTATFKDDVAIEGRLAQRECILREAVVQYSLRIVNSAVTLLDSPLPNATVAIIPSRNEFGGIGVWPATRGGFWLALNRKYASAASIHVNPPYWAVTIENPAALDYLSGDENTIRYFNVTWKDPMPDMLAMVRELSLRAAIATTVHNPTKDVPGSAPRVLEQTVPATTTSVETVWESNYSFLVAALVFIVASAVANIAMLVGWQRLGGAFTMSPIETAKAFDAPLLKAAESNAQAKDIVKAIREEPIKYGLVCSTEEQNDMIKGTVVSVSEIVSPDPVVYNSSGAFEQSRELRIERLDKVATPEKGQVIL